MSSNTGSPSTRYGRLTWRLLLIQIQQSRLASRNCRHETSSRGASPHVHTQIEAWKPLWPCPGSRHSPIAGILLTDAELDHTAGLLSLRQADCLQIYATDFVHLALTEWNPILGTLARCSRVERRA